MTVVVHYSETTADQQHRCEPRPFFVICVVGLRFAVAVCRSGAACAAAATIGMGDGWNCQSIKEKQGCGDHE